jgi:hypothetical protein
MHSIPDEPTSDQCNAHARLPDMDGKAAFAVWYPQMGGYCSKCIVLLDIANSPGHIGCCFDVWIWHDGAFPFSDDGDPEGRSPVFLHHCGADQFVSFGELILKLETAVKETAADV